ncbi:MAG: ThuA domain-containing protein, partial [bacterium]
GYKHASIPFGAKALEIIGKKTGAFEAVIRDDMAAFEKENLDRFDAVCFLSTTQLKFENQKYRRNLMDFVKGGKGVVGIHAATDNFYNWPEAAAMMGGLFDGHPWHSGGAWAVKIDDPEHPVVAAFQGEGFAINDEIYRIKKPYSRENLRVLLSLDFDDEATNQAKGIRPNDFDVPVSWVRSYGKGRVFYTSLGHNKHIYWNPAILQHYLDGIQFALDDLPADPTPSLDVALAIVVSYEYGHSLAPLTEIDTFIRFSQDSTEALRRLESRFLKILASDATLAGKQFICEKLRIFGTERSVPVLAIMLGGSMTMEMARYALEGIPGEAVNTALREAVQSAKGESKIGLVTSLGQRRDRLAVPLLAKHLRAADPEIVAAAIAALAEIGSTEAAGALAASKNHIPEELDARFFDALLVCANQLQKDGQREKAMALYRDLYRSAAPVAFRSAALRGLAQADSVNAGKIIIEAFRSEAPEIRVAAIRMVSEIQSPVAVKTIAADLPNLPAAARLQLLAALAERGEPDLKNAAVQALQDEQTEVRMAALKALARLGDASTAILLAKYASSHTGTEAKTARESLYRLRGEEVDRIIVKNIPASASTVKTELLRAAGARRILSSAAVVLDGAGDPSPEVRLAAIRTLRVIGSSTELSTLVDFLLKPKEGNERNELELTIAALAKTNLRAGIVLDALPKVKTVTARTSLLSVLGKIGDQAALPELRKSLRDSNIEIKSAAIRALSEWPDATPQAVLQSVTNTADNEIHRVLALRGYVRLLGIDTMSTATETAGKFREA